MLSEMSHSQKHKYCMIPLMYEVFKIVRFIGAKLHGGCQRLVGERGNGSGRLLFNGSRASVMPGRKVVEIYCIICLQLTVSFLRG